MVKKILFTRPCYDQETKYLHYFSGELVEHVKSIGEYVPLNLEGANVTRKEFEKALVKGNPRLVVLNGHGSRDSVCGHDGEVILDNHNVDKLNSKIVYAVACDSLEELGEFAVEEGQAESYIGYEAQFMIITDPVWTASPTKDKNIKPFRKVYAMMVLSLLAGLTTGEAIERTKELIRTLIREYGVQAIRDKYGDAPLIRWALHWDLFFLNAHGNLKAVV